jgi:hypothetical protein
MLFSTVGPGAVFVFCDDGFSTLFVAFLMPETKEFQELSKN